jgi:hypothetical protein
MTGRPEPRAVDRGRAAVAAVEEAAFGGTDADVAVDREVLHARIADVVAGPWWRACGPPVIVVTPRRSTRSSTARSCIGEEPVEIRLAETQLTTSTVAHELAHALAGVAHGHGETFRAAHVDVAAVLCGTAVAERLADTYAAFELAVGTRGWPPPWRADGESFRMVV